MKPKTKVEFTVRFLPIILGVLLILELLGVYRGWRILLVGLGGAWLIAYLWSRSLVRGLRLRRELRFGWVQVGDMILERLTLRNRGRFPCLWVEIDDRSTLPDHRNSRSISVGALHTVRWFKETACARRGLFTLGPMTLRTGDPFGIFNVHLEYSANVPVLVLPPVVPLPPIQLAAGGRAGEGRVGNRTLERTVSAGSVRQYVPGDVHRWIHWPTSARRAELHVRTFDAAPAGDLWIILDTNGAVHYGHDQDSSLEHAVILAASLADWEIRSGRAVGLVAADHAPIWLPPRGGDPQRWQILHSLALVSLGDQALAEVLLNMARGLGRETSLVILTADTDPAWVESLASLTQLSAAPTVMLLDPVSFGGQGDLNQVQSLLIDQGVDHSIIMKDLLEGATHEISPQELTRSATLPASGAWRSLESWEAAL
jgi:uncharacterized protein (DUF58 family)